MRILISKKFVLEFESGVIVIKHWRINNYLQKDRIQPTKYVEEKDQLILDAKGGYHKKELPEPPEKTDVYTGMYTQNSIDKDRIGKDNMPPPYIPPPDPETVYKYCMEAKLGMTEEEAKRFFITMEGQGWKHRNGQPIKDWRMMVAVWGKGGEKKVSALQYTQRDYTEEELLAVSDDLIEEAKKLKGGAK